MAAPEHYILQPGLTIIYEDAQLLVVDKQPWLLSVPGRKPEHHDSIFTRAAQHCGEVFVVHRLDCATSGVMLLAKTKAAERHLDQQFRQRETAKEYIAIGAGTAAQQHGEVNIALSRDWPNRPKQKFDEHGKPALTLFEVLEQQEQQARLRLTPITGRSHQLRMHMLHLGLPIIGDRLYAPEHIANACERLLLHANKLAITHPQSGEALQFTAQCPF